MSSLRRLAICVTWTLAVGGVAGRAAAVTIDWVTVGDPGNANDTTGYGAVAEDYRLMRFEFTNEQYKDFLNSVAATDPYALYNPGMSSNVAGGITRSGSSGAYAYAVKANMGDKPVNYVNWFDAARVANWLQNGATGTSSTETGAYTLVGGQTSGTAPGRNSGATFYIPTEDQWYKAAFYKGGGTNAGYWTYATQSDATPATVTASPTGVGSAGSTGNSANYNFTAGWNGASGNVTTVGTNGGPSAYGAFDLNGNVAEFNDLTGITEASRGLRGGNFVLDESVLVSSQRATGDASVEGVGIGFRLASPVPVPEPSTWVLGAVGAGCGGLWMGRRKRA